MGLTDFRPFVRVAIDGVPLGDQLRRVISSVSVTDRAGIVTDTARIEFANADALRRIAMPDPGAEIRVEMGYLGRFFDMGLYVADVIEETAPPRAIVVNCKAKAQAKTSSGFGPIHQQKVRSWPDGLSISEIASRIAKDNGLRLGVTESAGKIVPGHLDQIDESDLSLLTRLAITHDLIAKPAGGTLFIGRATEGVTASGRATPVVELRHGQVSRWRMTRSQADRAGTVIATYRSLDAGADIEVAVGNGEPVRRLRQKFRTKREAESAALSEARRSQRETQSLEVDLPGRPDIVADGLVRPVDFSQAASGDWSVMVATHTIDQFGFRSHFTACRPNKGSARG